MFGLSDKLIPFLPLPGKQPVGMVYYRAMRSPPPMVVAVKTSPTSYQVTVTPPATKQN